MASSDDDRRTVRVIVRMPDEVHRRLEAAAAERYVSVDWLATKANEEVLDRLIPVDEIRLIR
jgi:predicted HicB family RNase H-like nuclease